MRFCEICKRHFTCLNVTDPRKLTYEAFCSHCAPSTEGVFMNEENIDCINRELMAIEAACIMYEEIKRIGLYCRLERSAYTRKRLLTRIRRQTRRKFSNLGVSTKVI